MFQNNNNIVYISNFPWTKRGEIKKENRDLKQLECTLNNCWQKDCPSYCDGELHLCSRSFGIKRTVDSNIKDFVKITQSDCSKEIINLYTKKYFDVCDYCHTQADVQIPRGVQVGIVKS